jgi:hypothetical protein
MQRPTHKLQQFLALTAPERRTFLAAMALRLSYGSLDAPAAY